MEWEYLTREEWGANDSLPRLGYGVHPDDRTEIWNHHTVGIDNDATPNIWEHRADIIRWQRRLQTIRPDLGNDVPYNLVLYAQPNKLIICEGRGLMRTGAHTKYHNTSGIAGGWHGNFEGYDFNPLPWLPAWGDFLYHAKMGTLPAEVQAMALPNLGSIHPPGRETFGHRDSGAQTSCPGKFLYDQLRNLKVQPMKGDPMATLDQEDLDNIVDALSKSPLFQKWGWLKFKDGSGGTTMRQAMREAIVTMVYGEDTPERRAKGTHGWIGWPDGNKDFEEALEKFVKMWKHVTVD